MSDREMEERHLAQAERHITLAETNIVRLENLILRLQSIGRDTSIQTKLLGTLRVTLDHFLDHRDLILKALARYDETSNRAARPTSEPRGQSVIALRS